MNDAEKTRTGAQKTLAAQPGVLVRRRQFLGRLDPEGWSYQGDPTDLQARNVACGGKLMWNRDRAQLNTTPFGPKPSGCRERVAAARPAGR